VEDANPGSPPHIALRVNHDMRHTIANRSGTLGVVSEYWDRQPASWRHDLGRFQQPPGRPVEARTPPTFSPSTI